MDGKTTEIVINWTVALPVLVSALAPTITGFLQQFQVSIAQSKWYVKSILNAVIGGLLAMVASYAASGDLALSTAGGVILGGIGSLNIALRKGTRGNLEVSCQPKTPPTP